MPSGIFNPTLVFPSLSLSLSSSFSIFLFVTFSLFPFLFLFLFNFLYLFGNFALQTWSLCSLASPRTLDSPASCMLELQNVLSIPTLCSDLINNYPYNYLQYVCVCVYTLIYHQFCFLVGPEVHRVWISVQSTMSSVAPKQPGLKANILSYSTKYRLKDINLIQQAMKQKNGKFPVLDILFIVVLG